MKRTALPGTVEDGEGAWDPGKDMLLGGFPRNRMASPPRGRLLDFLPSALS